MKVAGMMFPEQSSSLYNNEMIRERQASSPPSLSSGRHACQYPTNIWLPRQPFFKSSVILSHDNLLLSGFKYCKIYIYIFPSLED